LISTPHEKIGKDASLASWWVSEFSEYRAFYVLSLISCFWFYVQVPKGGLFTSLLLHIAIPADGTFAFVGAHRGTTVLGFVCVSFESLGEVCFRIQEMVAWRLPCEDESW
jgi:hypothetical protein